MPEPEAIDQEAGLVKAIIFDQWTRDELVEYVMDHLSDSYWNELLKEAQAQGYKEGR
jgi:hypothetical protein